MSLHRIDKRGLLCAEEEGGVVGNVYFECLEAALKKAIVLFAQPSCVHSEMTLSENSARGI